MYKFISEKSKVYYFPTEGLVRFVNGEIYTHAQYMATSAKWREGKFEKIEEHKKEVVKKEDKKLASK